MIKKLANRATVYYLYISNGSSYEVTDIFDAQKEAAELKKRRKLKYQQRHGRSRLDRFEGQILALRKAGSRPVEIQDWLRSNRIVVSLSTVTRWVKKHG